MPVHPVSADCVWCYRFDEENATDNAVAAGGSWGKTLTQTGSPPVQDPAVWNKGRYFGAAGRYLDWGHTAWNAPGLDSRRMTIAGWLYWDGTLPANQSVLVQHWSEWYGWTEELRVWLDSSGFINFYVFGPFPPAFPIKAQLTSGIHHYVATIIGGTPQARQSIYIDGVRVHYSELNQNSCRIIRQGFAHIRIGGNAQDPTNTYWRGWLDDWAIYTTEKDQAWVSTYADAVAPTLSITTPLDGATDVATTTSIVFTIEDDDGVDVDEVEASLLDVEPDADPVVIWEEDAAAGGWTGSREATATGYTYTLTPGTELLFDTEYELTIEGADTAGNTATLSSSFTTSSSIEGEGELGHRFLIAFPVSLTPTSAGRIGHSFSVSSIEVVAEPSLVSFWNQFDEHALFLSQSRKPGETNGELKHRLFEEMAHQGGASYQGLLNAITHDLGFDLLPALSINPRVDGSGAFLAPDPVITFEGIWLYLWSDYTNGILDYAVNRFHRGGNFDTFQRLTDLVNSSVFFEAALPAGVDGTTRSSLLINQSNMIEVECEMVRAMDRFFLAHRHVCPGSVVFTDRVSFKSEVASLSSIAVKGDYYIDYLTGMVTAYSIPPDRTFVRYEYYAYPFIAQYSPIVLLDIPGGGPYFYNQVECGDGSLIDQLPNPEGVDIINELLSVAPGLYWGGA